MKPTALELSIQSEFSCICSGEILHHFQMDPLALIEPQAVQVPLIRGSQLLPFGRRQRITPTVLNYLLPPFE